ncbi:MAG: response regulator receiver protein [Gammaproteobacteria bacterium]|nr:response regulator receiver protein [Gammaproteobacteria bacterium]
MKEKVLLVEDNKTSAFYTKTNLEDLGYACDVAENAEASLQLFLENNYVSILMDISLGDEMNGYDATRKIRQIEAKTKRERAVIVALTGHAKSNVYENCLAAGMDGVLEKPLNKESFRELMKKG